MLSIDTMTHVRIHLDLFRRLLRNICELCICFCFTFVWVPKTNMRHWDQNDIAPVCTKSARRSEVVQAFHSDQEIIVEAEASRSS